MSYCKKCGAYIPDGQDVCLACGFDEAAEKRKQNTSSSSAYAYAPKSDDELRREEELRRRAEQRRRAES
jgi:thioredoxin reductase